MVNITLSKLINMLRIVLHVFVALVLLVVERNGGHGRTRKFEFIVGHRSGLFLGNFTDLHVTLAIPINVFTANCTLKLHTL